MKQNLCSIEPWPPEKAASGTSVLDILLEKDVLILACGSLSCMRGLYNGFVRRGRLDRFIPCYISKQEYALGRSEDVLLGCIRQTLERRSASAIILYVSCIEVLSGQNYDALLQRLGDTGSVAVRPFFRGPLLYRRQSLRANAQAVVADLPPAREASYGFPALPVPKTDFDAICTQACRWDVPCVLLTPGGCTGSLSGAAGEHCMATRFNDLFAGAPDWEPVADVAKRKCGEDPLFLKTAISDVLLPAGTEALSMAGCSFAPCNGWKSAAVGLSDYLLSETAAWSSGLGQDRTRTYTFGDLRGAAPAGENVFPWSPKLDTLPGAAIAVSSAGLAAARYLNARYGIPYKAGAPLREDRLERLGGLLAETGSRTVYLCGDPVEVNSVQTALNRHWPQLAVRKEVYCPVKSDRKFYGEFSDFCLIDGEAAFLETVRDQSVILADRELAPWFASAFPQCRFVSLDWLLGETQTPPV